MSTPHGKLEQLMERLQYTFQNKKLLQIALTHPSYAHEGNRQIKDNQRLEFLGDSVLGMAAAEYLFTTLKGQEGELTKLRAAIVCEKALCSYAKQLELGRFLYLGKGERMNGGEQRPSILADAFEAVIAAIYLDGGMEAAKTFVLPYLIQEIQNQREAKFRDYKTMLQEIIQQNPEEHLSYVLTGETGPDHNKKFTVDVLLNSNVVGTGQGRSKKDAEQQAARQALKLMGYDDV